MNRRSIATIFIAATLAAMLTMGATASARGLSKAVADCNAHTRLTATYTPAQLRQALNTMPSDIKEYTNCYDVIQRQLLSEIGGIKAGGGSGGGGSSFLPTPLLIVLGVLVVAAAGFAMIARRRR
jgi:hypothetical protein